MKLGREERADVIKRMSCDGISQIKEEVAGQRKSLQKWNICLEGKEGRREDGRENEKERRGEERSLGAVEHTQDLVAASKDRLDRTGQEGKSDEWVGGPPERRRRRPRHGKTWQDTTTSGLRYEEIGCGSSV